MVVGSLHLPDSFELSGKLSAICVVLLKGISVMGLADVNIFFTIMLTAVSIIYFSIKAYNELLNTLDRKRLKGESKPKTKK